MDFSETTHKKRIAEMFGLRYSIRHFCYYCTAVWSALGNSTYVLSTLSQT